MALFSGHMGAYGTYEIDSHQQGIKVGGRAVTKRAPVTEQLWSDHLSGKQGIGIVPIRDDNTCLFGAVDIDEYRGFDLKDVVAACKKMKAPVVVCRSKSGGAHIYMFLSEPVPAVDLRRKLKELATALGHGNSELFPKQDAVLSERGDVGNWINMPYFEGDGTSRYAVAENGSPLTQEQFLELAEKSKLTKANLIRQKFTSNFTMKSSFKDAPPCLEKLSQDGFKEGSRNMILFNLAVLARKRYPDGDWEARVGESNTEFFVPPLPISEVNQTIESAARKDYAYTCAQVPLRTYCNPGICRMRRYGVGVQAGAPRMSSLQKYNTDPPIWFLDLDNGVRLSLTTEELQNQAGFQKRCIEAVNYMPPKMNVNAWNQMIQALLAEVVVIEAPADASPQGQFEDMVERFCTGKAQAKHLDEILLGKPFHDQENKRILFRLVDLLQFLDKQKFKDYKLNQVSAGLRDLGGHTHTYRLNGKRATVWAVPEFDIQDKGHETPDFGDQSII